MALSLLVLIVIQSLWISYAIKTERAIFDKQVYDAMNTALKRADKEQVFNFIDSQLDLPEPDVNVSVKMEQLTELTEIQDMQEVEVIQEIEKMEDELERLEELNYRYIVTDAEHDVVYVGDTVKNYSKMIVRTPEYREHKIIVSDSGNSFFYDYKYNDSVLFLDIDNKDNVLHIRKLDSLHQEVEIKHAELLVRKEEMVKEKLKAFNEGIEQWVWEFRFEDDKKYLQNRINKYHESLSKALINSGIDLNYQYQVIREDDTVSTIYSSIEGDGLIPQQFITDFSPDDLFTKGLFLVLNFPDRDSHIQSKVFVLILGSIIFTLIIIATFSSTLYYIHKQKKLSEVKSDFINNMTHEFKTPIATIRLATDAMESPKVLGVEKPTKYYLDVIRQENKRMNNQVERVLQMALIDQGQLQLDILINDVHGIIQNCINVVELVAQKKNGKISSSLRASCYEIDIDEVHIANVINNLLDNAIKYTEKAPDINIETFNKGEDLFIRISDNGMGMTKEVQKHIFDKFYRKPMGNIHNIKGFGLGLSYVKAVVDAHQGEITVSSEPDNGSSFLLKFNCTKNRTHEG